MYLLPGNPFSHAVEAYRDSGEARCPKSLQAVPRPFSLYPLTSVTYRLKPYSQESCVTRDAKT